MNYFCLMGKKAELDVEKHGFKPYDLIASHKFGETKIYRHPMGDSMDYTELVNFKDVWSCEVIVQSQHVGYGNFRKVCFDGITVDNQEQMDFLLTHRWGMISKTHSQKVYPPPF